MNDWDRDKAVVNKNGAPTYQAMHACKKLKDGAGREKSKKICVTGLTKREVVQVILKALKISLSRKIV